MKREINSYLEYTLKFYLRRKKKQYPKTKYIIKDS